MTEAQEYSSKFANMIMRIPDTMYIFEVTKMCEYGEFVLIYKDMLVSEMIKVVATQFQDPSIHTLYFMNPKTQDKHTISITDPFTVRQLIFQFQTSETMREAIAPLYSNMENFVVYRVFI